MNITTSQTKTRAQVIHTRAPKTAGKQSGFRFDISYYYDKMRTVRATPFFPRLSVRHEVRAISLFIADDEFGLVSLCDYLGIHHKNSHKFPAFFAYYRADYAARNLRGAK
jgi:hypothetical protein